MKKIKQYENVEYQWLYQLNIIIKKSSFQTLLL